MKNFLKKFQIIVVIVMLTMILCKCRTAGDYGNDDGIIMGHVILTQNVTDSNIGKALSNIQTRYITTHNQLLIGCEMPGCTADYFLAKSTLEGLIEPNNTDSKLLEIYDEAFFAENNLILIVLKNSNNNSGDIVELKAIGTKENELNIIIDKYSGDATDVVYGLFIITIKKKDFDGKTVNVKVVLQ